MDERGGQLRRREERRVWRREWLGWKGNME